jgi:glucose-6-phosphate isomerase
MKDNEIFVFFEPRMSYFGEWLKQLFGESEGKGGRGLFPLSLIMSTDLHSIGQYLQDGKDTFFETMIYTRADFDVTAGMPLSLNAYNEIVYKSALNAHAGRGTPVVCFEAQSVSEASFGYMAYFFEKACAVSALLLGVYPFDQPGVEIYKTEMRKFIKLK